MSSKLFFLLFVPMTFCLKMYPIVKIEKSFGFRRYLHCSKSPNDSIHLFYKISSNITHLIYDQNEELVSKNNEENYIYKREYFDSDSEYLQSSYYVNEKENTTIYVDCDDFFILENKDFITIYYINNYGISSYVYLNIYYFSYPPYLYNKISYYSLNKTQIKYYEIIETNKAVLFFLLYNSTFNNSLNLYALDKKTFQLNRQETIADGINYFTLISLNNNNSDIFIYCFSNSIISTNCLTAKYNGDKLILENSIKVFPRNCPKDLIKFQKHYALLNNQTIAMICHDTSPVRSKIYLTLFQYKEDNTLILGKIVNKLIIEESYSFNIESPSIIYNLNKGLILYY